MKVGIVGGGIGGLAAGWDIAKAGHQVVMWEATHGTSVTNVPNNYWDNTPTLLDLVQGQDGKM